jgi:hypothetical protein
MLFGSIRVLADANAATVVSKEVAIDERLCPGWTTTNPPAAPAAGTAGVAPTAPGTCRTEPMTTWFGSAKWFVAANADTVVRYCAAMDEIVCPGSTTTVFFGAAATTLDAPGTSSTDPATIVFGSVRLLAASNAATVVPYSSAMPSNVSPGATLTVEALEGAKGDATTATVKAVPIITSRPILHDRSDMSKITATMLERLSDHYKGQC